MIPIHEKYYPLPGRALIRRHDAEEMHGSIIIPDTAKETPAKGEVVAVAGYSLENGERRDMSVSLGDVVLFSKYGGSDINLDGEEFVIMRQDDILLVAGKMGG